MAWIEFQHITDEMYLWKKYDCIKKEIDKMNKKTKQKLKELKDDFWIGIDKKETNEDIILEYEKTKGIEKLHEIKYIVLWIKYILQAIIKFNS